MRIAFIAPYQGPTVVERRPIVRNLSMSNRVKMELVAELLRRRSHEVVLISQGEVVEPKWRVYRAFAEPQAFHPAIPVDYASALPVRGLNGAWSSLSTVRLLRKHNAPKPFDIVMIFNLKWPQVAAAMYANSRLRVPVVLEYEDDAFESVHDERDSPLAPFYRIACHRVFSNVSGCTGVSPHLLSQLPRDIPRLLLRGVVGDDVMRAEEQMRGKKKNWVVFAGTHTEANGVGSLIEAWKQIEAPGWELHITGHGQLTPSLKAAAADWPTIKFHGLVSREELVRIISSAKICVNAHKVTETPGMVFAFKIIEYLGAGAHVLTTRMGALEPEVEQGMTYLATNRPALIATELSNIISRGLYDKTAATAVHTSYGPAPVSAALDNLLCAAVSRFQAQPSVTTTDQRGGSRN